MNQALSRSEKCRSLSASADPELERKLSVTLQQIRRDISAQSCTSHLSAIVLGGSYGRGEGGCVRDRDGRSHPYNDLDFFVFTRRAGKRKRRQIDTTLAEIGRRYTQQLGIDVDFSRSRNIRTLRAVANTLMFQELRRGHRILYGTDAFLEYLPLLPFEELPAVEALRLLMNRGVGLLLALQKSATNPGEVEFIRRNYMKAVLGCGDALLLASGRYSASVRERRTNLAEWTAAPGTPELLQHYFPVYDRMVEWKLQPYETDRTSVNSLLLYEAICDWLKTMICVVQLYSGRKLNDVDACLHEVQKNLLFQSGKCWKNGIFSLLYFRREFPFTAFFTSPQLKILEKVAGFFMEIKQRSVPFSRELFSSQEFCRMLVQWNRFN